MKDQSEARLDGQRGRADQNILMPEPLYQGWRRKSAPFRNFRECYGLRPSLDQQPGRVLGDLQVSDLSESGRHR